MKLKFLAQCMGCGNQIRIGQEAILYEIVNPEGFNSISFRHTQCQKLESVIDLSFMDRIMDANHAEGVKYY